MKLLIFISILLYGCGSENHGYGWEYDYKWNGMRVRGESSLTPGEIYAVYEKAVQCMGNKPPPFIIFVNAPFYVGGKLFCGHTFKNPPLIIIATIDFICPTSDFLLKHENIHYFGFIGHDSIFDNAESCM